MVENMNYKGDINVLIQVWDTIDSEGHGKISVPELSNWIRGIHKGLDPRFKRALGGGSSSETLQAKLLRTDIQSFLKMEEFGHSAVDVGQQGSNLP